MELFLRRDQVGDRGDPLHVHQLPDEEVELQGDGKRVPADAQRLDLMEGHGGLSECDRNQPSHVVWIIRGEVGA